MDRNAPSGNNSAAPVQDMAALATSELAAPQPHQQGPAPPRGKRTQICRYFGTKSGCRAGGSCPFIHELSGLSQQTSGAVQQREHRSHGSTIASQGAVFTEPGFKLQASQAEGSTGRQYDASSIGPSHIVQRPTTKAELDNPREFQLSQVRRRFSPKEKKEADETILAFQMRPSDPDFPFDIEALDCVLRVPSDYPKSGKPILAVRNSNMPRGYQINVEKGFDTIVGNAPTSTLLNYFNILDKRLEDFLASPMANTIKITSNLRKPDNYAMDIRHEIDRQPRQLASTTPASSLSCPANIPVSYTAEQISEAKARRDSETRQLEARLGRLPQFSKSSDGLAYTIPMEPRKRAQLPNDLKAIKTITLVVPTTYHLDPCRIDLVGVDGEAADNVQTAFQDRVSQMPQLSLTNHINYLAQNFHTMAIRQPDSKTEIRHLVPQQSLPSTVDDARSGPDLTVHAVEVSDRSHIVIMPRPLEWNAVDDNTEDTDGSSQYDADDGSSEAGPEGSDGEPANAGQASVPERGVSISFPHLELHGIELLELVTLSLTIKCTRCKDTMDVSNIKSSTEGRSDVRLQSCKKCANSMSIVYRMDLMHVNSIRAGHLDLNGCSVVDLLPSSFIPSCAECSSPYPSPGIISVRGETSVAFCRACHRKMVFRIPEVKFLLVGASAVCASWAPTRQKTEKLGIVAGQELPSHGRCEHYKKSYRWFRFSCCNRVFPCDRFAIPPLSLPIPTVEMMGGPRRRFRAGSVDVSGYRCHDQAVDHPIEHANRMICKSLRSLKHLLRDRSLWDFLRLTSNG
ncbi:hypothetical protein K432DRAFT_340518 [Lepidopterella palustris CBS 459.81]|uniref:C3H1-type domain-containing protein n=1 Tax=Lepidopterella palustris CBS 459.81 TaxID=1314670 RepID=A0A8E2DWZ0_9PEZI|nr:hypothetical protein K432DRAFT_340518 [Lepidopterella palustris CBS 459.81]